MNEETATTGGLRRRRILFRCAAVVLSSAVLLLVLEFVFRVLEHANPDLNRFYLEEPGHEKDGHRYVYDPLLGWKNIPGWSAKTVGRPLNINQRGLRDREHTPQKAPDGFRIVVLGDSFAWGYGVGDEQVFSQQLEKKLKNRYSNIEVINTGVSGWGTDQEYLYLTTEAFEYSPDVVVLAFFLVNDPTNNLCSKQYGIQKPYFVNTNLELANVPVPFPSSIVGEGKLARPSRLFNHSALGRFVILRSLGNPVAQRVSDWLSLLDIEADVVHSLQGNPLIMTTAIIRRIGTWCERNSCRFVLMKFGCFLYPDDPNIPAVEQELVFRLQQFLPGGPVAPAATIGGDQPTAPGGRGRPRRLGNIYYLDLDAEFAERSITNDSILRGSDGTHWNATGHQVVSEILAEFLESEGLLTAR